jgi:hypothetical protein
MAILADVAAAKAVAMIAIPSVDFLLSGPAYLELRGDLCSERPVLLATRALEQSLELRSKLLAALTQTEARTHPTSSLGCCDSCAAHTLRVAASALTL